MRNNKGFSLVELIVVIAIMAVLAAVAVIGVSIYVPRAQQAADKQLVSDVEQALNLYYQSSTTPIEGGYVILKPNKGGAVASDNLAEMMEDMFGSDWQNELSLAYDSWGNGGGSLISMVAGYEDGKFDSLSGASFLSPSVSTDGMMEAVGSLLSTAAGAINPAASKETTLNTLAIMGVDEATRAKLSDIYDKDATANKDNFRTAVANALVGSYSEKIDEAYSSDNADDKAKVDDDGLVKLMCFYANAYSYQEAMKGTEKENDAKRFYTAVDEAIKEVEKEGLEACGLNNLKILNGGNAMGTAALTVVGQYEGWADLLSVVGERDLWEGYWKDFGREKAEGNGTALKNMMGAVSSVAKNAEDLTNPNLFASPEIANQINAYRYAIQLREALGTIPVVNDNEIVILLLADGTIFSTIATGD